MAKYKYSPDVAIKIDQLCSNYAITIASDFPELKIDEIEKSIKDLAHFIKDNNHSIGTNEYLFQIDFEQPSSIHFLNASQIINGVQTGNNFFIINKLLSVLSNKRFLTGFSNSGLSLFSKKENCVLVFVHNGINLSIYCKGVNIIELNVCFPDALPVINKRTNHPPENYKLSIIDFYKEKVWANITNHWHNPSKRILKGGQTEDIFQYALTYWLMDNLTAKKINFKTKKYTNDETDIEIIKHGGDTYVIEIKWLGKNEGGSTLGESRIRDSFDQIVNYFDTEQDILELTLVVFDGRKDIEHQKLASIKEEVGKWKEIQECQSKNLPLKGKAFVFFLISESASKRKLA